MKWDSFFIVVILLTIIMGTTIAVTSEDNNRQIFQLSREACTLAWNFNEYKSDKCLERVMEAMSDEQGIRNRELQRRLNLVTQDLEICQGEN